MAEGRENFIPHNLASFLFDFFFTAILARGDTVTVASAEKAQVPSSLESEGRFSAGLDWKSSLHSRKCQRRLCRKLPLKSF